MIVVQNVSKKYQLYGKPSDRLLEILSPRRLPRHRDFWAVRNISFRVDRGEVFGLVGPNGSGKSTILQIVSGILRPTSGRVSAEGRIAALLELGAGFNPEFSGRENVYLNSEILGIPRAETQRLFPAIESFAEIGDFLDRPVKEYSSGMYVRLAFAAAIHVDPEILLVDEALAVGDAIFANRCLQKLEELRRRGVTILFVSHDLGLVKRLCTRAMLMHRGEMLAEGAPADVVNRYVGLVHEQAVLPERRSELTGNYRHGDGTSRITAVRISGNGGNGSGVLQSGEAVRVEVDAEFAAASAGPVVGVLVRNRLGMEIFGTNTRVEGIELGAFERGDKLRCEFRFECLLTRGEYTLTAATQHASGLSQDWLDDAIGFTVTDARDAAGVANLRTEVEWHVERAS